MRTAQNQKVPFAYSQQPALVRQAAHTTLQCPLSASLPHCHSSPNVNLWPRNLTILPAEPEEFGTYFYPQQMAQIHFQPAPRST